MKLRQSFYSGTKINIDYFLNDVMDEDHIQDIYEILFKDSETDKLADAIDELVRIIPKKRFGWFVSNFLSEWQTKIQIYSCSESIIMAPVL
jgi:ATP-dependent DNA helicase RecQ